jgi:hypothetical protein
VQDGARRVLQVADEHDLKFGRALGRCLLGAANTGSGRPEDGLADVHDGLDLYHSLKTPPVFSPLVLYVQASRKALRQLIFWKPATFWKPLVAGCGKGGGSIPAQANTTGSPRRMAPPLTTEAYTPTFTPLC